MQPSRFRSLVEHLWQGTGPPLAAATDAQLLAEYASGARPEAFDELLQRHGRLVYGACRRILGNAHDAEDAFQATFLVLARKAGSVRWQASAAGWLYLAACQTARQARTHAQRRRQREAKVAAMTREATESLPEPDDWRPLLDAQLECLPDRYRLPLVLCYLQGRSTEEAARLLHCPVGTLKVRLLRGRARLRSRLERRGLTLPAAALGTVLTQAAAEAAVPAVLVSASLQAARLLAAGETAAGTLSLQAITLAEGTVQAMFVTKLKMAAVLLLLVGVLGTGAGLVQQGAAQPQPVAQAPAPGERSPEKPAAPGQARGKLDLHGDPLPPDALACMGTMRFRHRGSVLAFAYAPDGKTLISADSDGSVLRWDAATGKERQRFPLPPGFLAFSPDGTVFASVDNDNPKVVKGRAIRLWNAATGKEFAKFQWRGAVDAWLNVPKVALSPDGKSLALGNYMGDQVIRFWDIASGKEIRQIEKQPVEGLLFSPDSRMLLTRNTESFLWDVARGKKILEIGTILDDGPTRTTLRAGPRSAAFSPDGKILALGNRFAGDQVVFLDVATGKQIHELKGVYKATFSRDGKSLAAAGKGGFSEPLKMDCKIVLLDVELTRTRANDGSGAQNLAFAPDGRTVAAATGDIIRQWDVASGKEIGQRPAHTAPVRSVRIAPDGKTLASAGDDGTIRLWDAATGREIRQIQWPRDSGGHGIWSVDFSPNGKTLAAADADSTIRLWEVATGREIRTLRGHTRQVFSVAFAPDGKTLASAGEDGTIRLWQAATGHEIRTLQAHADQRVQSLVFSLDGKTLAAAGGHGIQLWDAATGQQIRKLQGDGKATYVAWHSVVLSPDGKVLSRNSLYTCHWLA
jgi:RNA polymerase sigma factor (sigma-70 family)